ncbi:helix-turn-helix transcriptional regulator [Roseivirga sp.]|uniref:helix-turn-helix transcriptional regulator n=1 Tax=Roseivirga sp. TaxID=1964215 RepID=UPI003B5164E5
MILEHQEIHLMGKKVFERVVVSDQFKRPNYLENEACFLYLMNGSNVSYSQSGSIHMSDGEGVLMKCGNYLFDLNPKADSGTAEMVAIHLHPDVLEYAFGASLYKVINEDAADTSKSSVLVKRNQLVETFFNSLRPYFTTSLIRNEELIATKLREVILLLLHTASSSSLKEVLSVLFTPRTYSFRQTIAEHIFSDLSIPDLANLTHLSLASFKREFHRVYNESPASYIRNKRLERAAELLKVSDSEVSQIAMDCMFKSSSHFISAFRKKYGLSPKEYRLSQN